MENTRCCSLLVHFHFLTPFSTFTTFTELPKRTQLTTLLQQLARCGEALKSWLPTAVEFRRSRMKMYNYYFMEMQSKFICVLPTSLQNLVTGVTFVFWVKRLSLHPLHIPYVWGIDLPGRVMWILFKTHLLYQPHPWLALYKTPVLPWD